MVLHYIDQCVKEIPGSHVPDQEPCQRSSCELAPWLVLLIHPSGLLLYVLLELLYTICILRRAWLSLSVIHLTLRNGFIA